MNKLLLAATALLVAAPVLAQTMPAGQPERRGQGMGQGMGMKDKVQTRAEVIARTQRAFAMLDTNHDGNISRDEFARAPMNHGMGGGAGSGGHGRMGSGGGAGGGMARMWSMADANHDGRVTLKEATDMALMRFDRMDANHDGQVTPEERAAARALRGK